MQDPTPGCPVNLYERMYGSPQVCPVDRYSVRRLGQGCPVNRGERKGGRGKMPQVCPVNRYETPTIRPIGTLDRRSARSSASPEPLEGHEERVWASPRGNGAQSSSAAPWRFWSVSPNRGENPRSPVQTHPARRSNLRNRAQPPDRGRLSPRSAETATQIDIITTMYENSISVKTCNNQAKTMREPGTGQLHRPSRPSIARLAVFLVIQNRRIMTSMSRAIRDLMTFR